MLFILYLYILINFKVNLLAIILKEYYRKKKVVNDSFEKSLDVHNHFSKLWDTIGTFSSKKNNFDY